jgi:hypothetical protein
LASDYAELEGLATEEVLAGIRTRRILGGFFRDAWYVEAPAFCEERLSCLRNRPRQNHNDADKAKEKRLPDKVAAHVSKGSVKELVRRLKHNWNCLTQVQRIALLVSTTLIIVVLFPPFHFRRGNYTINMGFGFLFSPPTWGDDASPLNTAEVNIPMLAIKLAVTLIIGGLAYLALPKTSSDSRDNSSA